MDTTAPLQTITVEKSLYEMKQFEFKLLNPFPADCDFEVTLAQSSVDPEADAKAQAEKKRKAMTRQKSRGATTALSLPLVRCNHPSILSAMRLISVIQLRIHICKSVLGTCERFAVHIAEELHLSAGRREAFPRCVWHWQDIATAEAECGRESQGILSAFHNAYAHLRSHFHRPHAWQLLLRAHWQRHTALRAR